MTPSPLKKWIQQLQKEDMPVFAQTAQQIAALVKQDNCTAHDLANVILQDGPMTAKLLRMVKSAYYKHSGKEIDTISYAIVLLGIKKVSNLALTVSLLESITPKFAFSHVQKEMAYAYHAALLAQALAHKSGANDTESVYIAALLYRLGHLMFWCFPYGCAESLEKAYTHSMSGPVQVEKEVLGFSLDQLTNALIDEWGISPLLHDILVEKKQGDPRLSYISHAYSIANVVRHGWNSKATHAQIVSTSAMLECEASETFEMIEETVKTARSIFFNFYLVDELLPLPQLVDHASQLAFDREAKKSIVFSEAAHCDLRNRLLRQLTHMLSQTIDLNRVMLAVLEGVKAATFCDQTFTLLCNSKNNHIFLHQHIGAESEAIATSLLALIEREPNTRLIELLQAGTVCWPQKQIELQGAYRAIFPSDNYLLFPLVIHTKPVGYIVAVRSLPEPPLNEWDFEFFNHFCEHANVAFRLSARQD